MTKHLVHLLRIVASKPKRHAMELSAFSHARVSFPQADHFRDARTREARLDAAVYRSSLLRS